MSVIEPSGQNHIDSLLYLDYDKWNNVVNGKTVITYSFLNDGDPDQPFSLEERELVWEAFKAWEAVANIRFVEDTTGNGSIRIFIVPGWDAWLSGIGSSNPVMGLGAEMLKELEELEDKNLSKYSPGYYAILHEIGHALLLKHPGNYDSTGDVPPPPYLPPEQDNYQYSLMSYNGHPGSLAYPGTPMLFDIAAVQYLYDANYMARPGDDDYVWDTNIAFVETIWDWGGTDNIGAVNQTLDATIDLNWASNSSIGPKSNGSSERAFNNLTIPYGVTIENATGGTGNDIIYGNSVANGLHGNTGNDKLYGGSGNDYLEDQGGDDYLSGDEGNDFLFDWIGNDTLNGGSGNDDLSAGLGDNHLYGDSGNDGLVGGNGNDYIDGGLDSDQMYGGFGNDIYVLDNSGDIITENFDEGIDIINSTISYTLGANLENLTLSDSLAVVGFGNNLDNYILGNSFTNSLTGGEGNDSLDGSNSDDLLSGGVGNDVLEGGSGYDQMYGDSGNDLFVVREIEDSVIEYAGEGIDTVSSYINYNLDANVENLTLLSDASNGYGSVLSNTITGNTANNYLYGADGTDTLEGQEGNDYLYGQSGNDSLLGDLGEDWLLGDVGNDSLTGGIGKDWLIAGLGDDLIAGEQGKDHLNGGVGDDTLSGGTDRDWLTGDTGADQFLFSALAKKADIIKDFRVLDGDTIAISTQGFSKKLKIGKLSKNQFTLGSMAEDKGDRFIYNSSTGKLFFDTDGIGDEQQIHFATLSKDLSLTNRSFLIVA